MYQRNQPLRTRNTLLSEALNGAPLCRHREYAATVSHLTFYMNPGRHYQLVYGYLVVLCGQYGNAD
jgi:hypothetical protein